MNLAPGGGGGGGGTAGGSSRWSAVWLHPRKYNLLHPALGFFLLSVLVFLL